MKYIDVLHKLAEDNSEKHTLRNAGLGAAGTALTGAAAYGGYQALDTLKGLDSLADVALGNHPKSFIWRNKALDHAIAHGFNSQELGNVASARNGYKWDRGWLAEAKALLQKANNMDWSKVHNNGALASYAHLSKDDAKLVLQKIVNDRQANVDEAAKNFAKVYGPYKSYARALLRTHPKMLKLFKMLKLR